MKPDSNTTPGGAPDVRRVVFLSAARQVWGAEVSLLTLAGAMIADGVPTAVVCPAGELSERAVAAGVGEVVPVSPSSSPDRARTAESWRIWSAYSRVARPGDHVVVFSYYLLGLAPVFAPALRRRAVRVSLDLHDTLESRKARWSVQLCCHFIDGVVACSEFTARQVPAGTAVAALHRPVDPATLPRHDRADRRDGALRVGIVGRISPEKRHSVLIDALASLPEPIELVVRGAGDGWSDAHVRNVLESGRRRLGERFVVEGRVPSAEALADLDAVVVGNPREPMGRTVLEAQISGVVAIVPDSGGAAELVDDGRTGFVYAHDNPADLARVLTRMRDDRPTVARILAGADCDVPRPGPYARDYLAVLERSSAHRRRFARRVPVSR